MQFARYTLEGTAPQWGVLIDGTVHSLTTEPTNGFDLSDLTNPGYRDHVRHIVSTETQPTVQSSRVSFLAPVSRPGKIVAVGLNYRDHAEEQDADIPDRPLLFGKAPSSVINPGAAIVHPAAIEKVDYEVELAIVIGRRASDLPADHVMSHVAGFTILNDISARDAQFEDRQWFRGKSYDTFAPLGPILVTPDDFDPHSVDVSLRVNGETKQSSNTNQLIFNVNELVEYISHVMTLYPGDVIATGTPGGVGVFRDPPDLLAPGDVVAAEIEGIGTLENHVVASD